MLHDTSTDREGEEPSQQGGHIERQKQGHSKNQHDQFAENFNQYQARANYLQQLNRAFVLTAKENIKEKLDLLGHATDELFLTVRHYSEAKTQSPLQKHLEKECKQRETWSNALQKYEDEWNEAKIESYLLIQIILMISLSGNAEVQHVVKMVWSLTQDKSKMIWQFMLDNQRRLCQDTTENPAELEMFILGEKEYTRNKLKEWQNSIRQEMENIILKCQTTTKHNVEERLSMSHEVLEASRQKIQAEKRTLLENAGASMHWNYGQKQSEQEVANLQVLFQITNHLDLTIESEMQTLCQKWEAESRKVIEGIMGQFENLKSWMESTMFDEQQFLI